MTAGGDVARRRRRVTAVVLTVAALGSTACLRVPDPGPDDISPEGYVAPPAAEVITSIAYGPDPKHVLDLYLPPVEHRPAPVVVWVHPGGWAKGERNPVPELLLRQVDRVGAAVVTADFRTLHWQDGELVDAHPAPSQDIDRLIRWLRVEGPALGLGAERIILVGGSSGGHLAALAGVAPGRFVDPTVPVEHLAVDPAPSGVVSVSASLDLTYQVTAYDREGNMARTFLGCADSPCDPVHVSSASPIEQVGPASSPAYVVAGELDQYVPPERHATPYVAALRSAVAARDRAAGRLSVWYDFVEDHDHNVEYELNRTELERWIDLVLAGTWAGSPGEGSP